MNRHHFAPLAASLLILMSSCIYEDQSDCPPLLSVDLTFSYHGDTHDPAMFSRMIESVDLYAFSLEDGSLSYSRTFDKAYLDERQGASLPLPGGRYRIYTWGNVGGNSAIIGADGAGTWGIASPALFSGEVPITTNDHLYQGGIEIDVPSLESLPDESVTKLSYDIRQCGAHINFEVYVKGVGDKDIPSSYPALRIGKLMPEYGVDMRRMRGFESDYYPVVSWDTSHNCTRAVFQTLRFEDDNDIVLSVLESASSPVEKANVVLRDFLSDNMIPVSGLNEVTIYIMIEFTDLGVSISIPEWTKKDITPDLP